MKPQKLSKEELAQTNGGSLLGNDSSYNDNSLTGSLGIGNLFSGSNSRMDGDESSSSSYSAGNGINLDLSSITKKLTD